MLSKRKIMDNPMPMVSSSIGVVNSLLDKLTKLEGYYSEFKDLTHGLESIRKDLLKFAARGVKSMQVKQWMKQVREVFYDMEDWIDLIIHLAGEFEQDKPERATDFGWSELAEKIEEFKAQIHGAQDRCTRYGLLNKALASDADLADLGPSKVTIDPNLLWGEKTGLVALEGPENELVNHLMDEEQKLKVVSVHGVGGLGKTTLAEAVFEKLQWRFECRAFVYGGQNPSVKTTLINILYQVMPLPRYEVESWCEKYVISKLWEFLGKTRYFIVIDDIWSIWAWSAISCTLPDNNLGSRILMTTRIDAVAKSCCVHPTDFVHPMKALSECDSKSLLLGRISVPEEDWPFDSKISDNMLKLCGGKPLAIIVTAGLLDAKCAELGQQKMLEKPIFAALDQYSTSEGIKKILDISFADLSLPVKSCLSYLSAFPEDYIIKKDHLIRIWVAEGFIPKRDKESLWETGESYFNELISRRLIQPVFLDDDYEYDGGYDDDQPIGCTVHDVILDFIVSLSSKENFVTPVAEFRSMSFPRDVIRRLSLNNTNHEDDTLIPFKKEDDKLTSSTVDLSKVRLLSCFGDAKGMPDLSKFRFLRVLDLNNTMNLKSHHLESIGRLFLLGYLGLRGSGVTVLPEEIGRLQHMEILDLRRNFLGELPASIVGLRKLVCLLLDCCVRLPRGVDNMPDLDELTIQVDRPVLLNDVAEIVKSKRLRMLGVRWGGYSHDRRSVMSFLNEVGKSSLQSLLLQGYPAGDLLHLLLDSWVPPHQLRRFELTISSSLGGVPHKMASLVNLTHLRIKIDRVETEGLRVLGALPSMILLNLHSKYSGFERLIISRDGFRCLVVFSYTCGYSSGMGLQFTPGAMKHLRRLRFEFNAQETGSRYGDFDFGIQHLSCLTRVHAIILCWGARDLESADAADAAIREQVSKNPNNPVLELKREEHENLPESYKIRYIPTKTMEFDTGAMGSLLTKLGELLKEEYKLQKDLRAQVQSLSRELEIMHAALCKVAEVPREQLDEVVKLWAHDAREQSYDMEDIIDTFLVHVEDDREAMPNTGNLFSKGKTRNQIANMLKDINNQVKEMANRHGRHTVDSIVAMPTATSTIDPRPLAMYKDVAQLIGIDGPRDTLINMLSEGDDASNKKKMKIVSVVGFVGLGKTTLAKAVYDRLKAGFDCYAFVQIGQNPDMKKVFKDFLIDLDYQRSMNLNVTMLDERQLICQLQEFLENKRYFIIIDDIWDKKSWEIIRYALVDSNCGSRVLATTRIFEVATNADDVYKLQPLSHDNSEKLFNTRIVDCEGKRLHNQSTEVYDKIWKKCGGVPLAIITIASLLADKPGEDWSEVYNSIGFGYGDNDDVENTRKILSLSYYDLPFHLRSCLLYLCIFPEDYVINKNLLIWKWIAEGFIHDEQGIGLLEVGEGYFNELVSRSMIKPDEVPDTGYVVGCRVHDMVLDLVRYLSSEENFVTILDNEQQTFQHSNARRLALQNKIEEHNPLAKMGVEHMRSFTAIWCDIGMISPSFRVLRVLAIEYCGFMEAYNGLEHLGNLLHLRYLGLSYTPVHELPKEIGDLKFLQTLELTETGIEDLSSSVCLLKQLVCLRADRKTRVLDWIGYLTSLQELWIHPTADRSARFVKELGNLRELRVLRATVDVRDESLERALVESLGNLHKIQHVDIRGEAFQKGATWEAGPVAPRLLRYLLLRCLEFSRLPAWINSLLLPNLCFLHVKVQVVQEQDMETLGRLPQLRGLRLWSTYTRIVSIIGGDGQLFHKLRFFTTNMSIRFVHSEFSMAPIMPSLEAIQFEVKVRFLKDANLGFDKLGLENLPSLQRVIVGISCWYARAAEVEEADAALRHAAAIHPNRPTLIVERIDQDEMLSSGQDQEPTRWSRKVVDWVVDVRGEKDDEHYFNFCQLLRYPCVEKVSVCINCEDAIFGEVEEAEAALRHAVDVHPNHPTLEITRYGEDKMMPSDQHQQQQVDVFGKHYFNFSGATGSLLRKLEEDQEQDEILEADTDKHYGTQDGELREDENKQAGCMARQEQQHGTLVDQEKIMEDDPDETKQTGRRISTLPESSSHMPVPVAKGVQLGAGRTLKNTQPGRDEQARKVAPKQTAVGYGTKYGESGEDENIQAGSVATQQQEHGTLEEQYEILEEDPDEHYKTADEDSGEDENKQAHIRISRLSEPFSCLPVPGSTESQGRERGREPGSDKYERGESRNRDRRRDKYEGWDSSSRDRDGPDGDERQWRQKRGAGSHGRETVRRLRHEEEDSSSTDGEGDDGDCPRVLVCPRVRSKSTHS